MKNWPPLFQVLGKSLFEGIMAGWAVLTLLFIFNFSGFADKVFHTGSGVLATFVLAVLFAITFGSAAMGIAIMSLPYPKIDEEADQ